MILQRSTPTLQMNGIMIRMPFLLLNFYLKAVNTHGGTVQHVVANGKQLLKIEHEVLNALNVQKRNARKSDPISKREDTRLDILSFSLCLHSFSYLGIIPSKDSKRKERRL